MTRRGRGGRIAALVTLAATLATACNAAAPVAPSAPPSTAARTSPPPAASSAPARREGPSASEVLARLCDAPSPPRGAPAGSSEATPAAIAQVEQQVASVRGLSFVDPVAVEAVSREELAERVRSSSERSLSGAMLERRTEAWQTIGVMPPDVTIGEAIERFVTGQVVGFYVPETGRLVFAGSDEPSGLERFTLAHELTHALDDQHFRLERTGRLRARCRDEASMAALGAIEGSATHFSLRYAREFLSLSDLGSLLSGAVQAPSTAGVPPFIVDLETWPYLAGQAFVAAREAAGGLPAVNRSLERFPRTTEQVIHPEAYGVDQPSEVDIPNYGPSLGRGWRDLDVMEVGEAWLSMMLALRLDDASAADAAAGWDGGIYRAWSKGAETAVVLATAWDTESDAQAFASAMRRWLGDQPGSAGTAGRRAIAVFASAAPLGDRLAASAGTGPP